jgi:hypothetical protein
VKKRPIRTITIELHPPAREPAAVIFDLMLAALGHQPLPNTKSNTTPKPPQKNQR